MNKISVNNLASVVEIVKRIVPLPKGSILFGMATDGYPVLFNAQAHDSPNVMVWDRMPGQGLRLIKVAIEFLTRHNPKDHTEFIIFSNHTKEWGKLNENNLGMWNTNECVAIVPFWDIVADQVLFALAGWISKKKATKSPTILFIDGFENICRMGEESQRWLRYIMLCGRVHNIYVVGTASAQSRESMVAWMDCFHMEIFGQDLKPWLRMEKKEPVLFYTPETSI